MSKPMAFIPNPNDFHIAVISGLIMIATKFMNIFINIYTWHVPPIIMEGGQLLAWIGVVITTIIAILKYFKIQIPNPFKKKK